MQQPIAHTYELTMTWTYFFHSFEKRQTVSSIDWRTWDIVYRYFSSKWQGKCLLRGDALGFSNWRGLALCMLNLEHIIRASSLHEVEKTGDGKPSRKAISDMSVQRKYRIAG